MKQVYRGSGEKLWQEGLIDSSESKHRGGIGLAKGKGKALLGEKFRLRNTVMKAKSR